MATNQEIAITDSELYDLMAELEAETADMVVIPTVAAEAPAPAPEPVPDEADDDAAEQLLALEVEAAAAVAIAEVAAAKEERRKYAAAQAEKEAPKPVVKVAPVAPVVAPVNAVAVPAELEPIVVTVAAAPVAPVAHPNPVKAAALQHYIDMASFRDEIRISPANIDTAMMEQAGLFAFHGEESARAEAQAARLKLRFDIVEAALYDKHRKAYVAAGEKTTERMIDSAVLRDPEYVGAKNRVIEAEFIASTRKACVAAMRDRKDMLVQIGADRREEGKGQLRMLEQDAGHADAKSRALRAAS